MMYDSYLSPCSLPALSLTLVQHFHSYVGDVCQHNVDECSPVSPCLNGATCYDLYGSYECACVPGYGGKHCELVSDLVPFLTEGKAHLSLSYFLYLLNNPQLSSTDEKITLWFTPKFTPSYFYTAEMAQIAPSLFLYLLNNPCSPTTLYIWRKCLIYPCNHHIFILNIIRFSYNHL